MAKPETAPETAKVNPAVEAATAKLAQVTAWATHQTETAQAAVSAARAELAAATKK